MKKTWLITVTGMVQGVGFRYATHHFVKNELPEAHGYVRNLPSGQVEILLQGTEQELDTLLSFLRKGPRLAHVTDLDIREISANSSLRKFEIRH